MVRLALVSRPPEESEMRLAGQMGVTDIVSILPDRSTTPQEEQGSVWEYGPFIDIRKQVEDAGLTLSVIESIPISRPGAAHDVRPRVLPRVTSALASARTPAARPPAPAQLS